MQEREAARKTSVVGSPYAALRRAAFRASLGLALASCADPRLPGPSEPEFQPVTLPTPSFPALSRPGTIYLATQGLYSSIRDLSSRYVLYEDNTFALQFVGPGESFDYLGRYTRAGSVVAFDDWDGWSTAGPWGATGTLRGDSLVVKYNLVMQMTDFIDGTYVRLPATP